MLNIILIYDFGSQYTQLIARRIRELDIFCEISPYYEFSSNKKKTEAKGIIFSGSPFSVLDNNAPSIDFSDVLGKLPVMGICYGAQLYSHLYGGKVTRSSSREYGQTHLINIKDSKLMQGIKEGSRVWMSHGDAVEKMPEGCEVICSTKDTLVAGYCNYKDKFYGLQFHPEVYHSQQGSDILRNFVVDICKCEQNWTRDAFIETSIKQLKERLKGKKVLAGLSGGVDSTVTATLLHKAIGKDLYCVFVDTGLLRKNEFELVLESYKNMGLNITGVRAEDKFLNALKGLTDPEKKRKAIGKTFIDVFEEEAKKISGIEYLAQGTIYPDVIESASVNGPSATIKSHHNVGGLPEKMNLKIVEPLKLLFKYEVRKVGLSLGIDTKILNRHPFPGPGLGIRIIGEVNKESLTLLKEADDIFIRCLKEDNLYDKVWQAFVILLPVQTVGVMGDERTYAQVVVLRAVGSTDGMTADWSNLPYEFLSKVSNEIINKVSGINRVVYDISSKPPSTIEWE